MKVLVCGGRAFHDKEHAFKILDGYRAEFDITDVIHGGARGADMLAHEWAYQRNLRMWPFPAEWKKHGKSAGPIRNQQMIDEGKPDCVIAFPGGHGTADMVQRAREANIPVFPVLAREVSR